MRSIIRIMFIISISFTAYADNIKMASGDWCPYVCDPKIHNGMMGYLPDIAKIVFEKAGHQFSMTYMPFSRAVSMTKEGSFHGIPGVYRADVPDFIFPKDPQGIGGNEIYVLKSTDWRFTGLESLKSSGIIFGIVKTYTYGAKLDKFIKNNPNLFFELAGDDPQGRSIKMLTTGRIKAWIEDARVAEYNIMKAGMSGKTVSAGSLGERLPVYVGFSPRVSKSKFYATIIANGVTDLRKSGELSKILSKYGLKDWKE